MSEYYWRIIQFDGTETDVSPAVADIIKRKMANKEPINTRTMTIPANQIKSFRITERPFNSQPILDAVAGAFNEPVLVDEAMAVKWVKKNVPSDRYNKHYGSIPAYRRLGTENGMVVVAYKLPVHQININEVSYCSDNDIKELTTRQ